MTYRSHRALGIAGGVATLLGVCVSNSALAAALVAKDSRLVEVTVYPDRAEVVREAQVTVPAGASTVEFAEIPFAVEPDSVRVSAKGVPAVLGAVELRARAEEPKETQEQVALRNEVKRIEGEIAKLAAKDRTAGELREFLTSLRATTGTRESEHLGSGRADPATLQAVYDLLATRLSELGEQELLRRDVRERLGKDLEVARAKLAAARPAGSIRSRAAEVEIEASQAGSLILRIAYLASEAFWYPSYRATLDAKTGEVALVSEGIVRQATGEDWSAVALRLSTASPARGVAPPEMASLLLRPLDTQFGGAKEGFADESAHDLPVQKRAYQNVITSAPPAMEEALRANAEVSQAVVVHSAYNVAFEVPGRSDVPADGAEHRVVLRQETLPGTLGYRAAPAVQPAAYLTSIVRAPSRYPLLAGPMRVLVDGTYLGTYALPETAPGAELTLPFGLDNRVRVQRVRQPQERGSEGISGKTRHIAYEFRTTLENLRDENVTVTLEDRVPVSEDERVVVEMSKATTAGSQESKHRPGVLLWKINLGSREKKDVSLGYTVRFPKDLVIPGLD